MTQHRDQHWQDEVREAMNDPEVCRAFGRLVLEVHGLLGYRHRFESVNAANAFYQILDAARYQLGLSGRWRQRLCDDGRSDVAPLDMSLDAVAQQLCYDSSEAITQAESHTLAQLAVQLDSDCADAYSMLAEATPSLEEKKRLYERAVQAAERRLGPERFRDDRGHFWGIVETRPYMRARAGLADCLWQLGRHRQAIEHYQALLRLNDGDNLGLRYLLASCLLEADDDDGFAALLDTWLKTLAPLETPKEQQRADEYEDAMWLYPRALFTFRRQGSGNAAKKALACALRRNSYVP